MITILKIIFAVLVLFLIYISISLYLVSNERVMDTNKYTLNDNVLVEENALDITNGEEIISSDVDLSKVEWTMYVNPVHGLHFSYPSDFIITADEVKHTYKNGEEWYYIFFNSNVRKQKTRFSVDINPDGIGPFFIDKRYVIKKNKNGKTVISSIVDETDQQILNDGIVWLYASLINGRDNFELHFIYEDDGELDNIDYNAMFVNILESVEIK